MKEKELKNIFNNEIEKRMNSDSWNHSMAAMVFAKKNQTRRRIIYSTSISSLAVAALLLIVFLFGINDIQKTDQFEHFISNQIEGTYNYVFNKNAEFSYLENKDEGMMYAGDIDSIINETLDLR